MALRAMRIRITFNHEGDMEKFQEEMSGIGVPCAHLGRTDYLYNENSHYFQIITDSEGYKKVEEKFPRVLLCDNMQVANKLDCDNEFFNKMKEVMEMVRSAKMKKAFADRMLHEFVSSIENIEDLEVIMDAFKYDLDEQSAMFFEKRIKRKAPESAEEVYYDGSTNKKDRLYRGDDQGSNPCTAISPERKKGGGNTPSGDRVLHG